MKNLFKWTTLMLALLVVIGVACDEDTPEPDNTPSPVGTWVLASATLVDGDASTPEADNLVILNYTQDGQNFTTLDLAPGSATVEIITQLVGGALAGNVCDIPTNYGGFYMELTEDNKLIFYCPAEDGVNDQNSWNLIANTDGTYTVSLNVVTAIATVSVLVEGFEVAEDRSTMSGQAINYPMVKDLSKDLGAPIDGGGINLQNIIVNLAFTAKP